MEWKGLIGQLSWVLGGIAISGILILVLLNGYVWQVTRDQCYTETHQVPVVPVAMILGAGVWEDGTPTPMLADRVQGGVNLYKLKRVRQLLMTGDHSGPDYNEVAAMERYAISQGVPGEDIILDGAGFNTYQSCDRAHKVFGITQVVVITQKYHLPRAVYTCRHLGLEAVGFGLPDWGNYRPQFMGFYVLREIFAVVKALWQVHLSPAIEK